MGVFDRISRIIRSNISELLDRVEDPEKVLQQIMIDMQKDLKEAKLQVAAAIIDQKKLENLYQQNLATADSWEKRAVSAVEDGNDALAKEALRRKKTFEQTAQGYKEQMQKRWYNITMVLPIRQNPNESSIASPSHRLPKAPAR